MLPAAWLDFIFLFDFGKKCHTINEKYPWPYHTFVLGPIEQVPGMPTLCTKLQE
jgi:hypothetical protein